MEKTIFEDMTMVEDESMSATFFDDSVQLTMISKSSEEGIRKENVELKQKVANLEKEKSQLQVMNAKNTKELEEKDRLLKTALSSNKVFLSTMVRLNIQ